jgi:8-hydroxy-5-deazaflavin:NADPH oxidoreductase
MKTNTYVKPGRRAMMQAAAAALTLGSLPAFVLAQTGGAKTRIGIIGSGNVGSAIGGAWVKAGHEVMFSSLDIEHDKKLAASLGGGARAGTPREAATFGAVLMISVPYRALPGVGKDLADLIKGKVVIDTSNPIIARDGDIAVAAREKGAGLASLEYLPGARIVRAFNAVGAARMAAAHTRPAAERVGMPIAGDDEKAIATASALIRDAGYEPVLIGTLAGMGRHLIPGTALAGERSPDEIRKVAATLK